MLPRLLLFFSLFWLAGLPLRAQTNLVTDPGFEGITAGTSSYTTNLSGTVSGTAVQGRWQLTFVTGTCSTTTLCSGPTTGCSSGSSVITTTDRNSGNQSLYMRITKHTNRNDIKLYQVLSQPVAAGSYEVSFFMKSDGVSLVTLNVFKSTAAATANGGETSGTVTGTASSFSSTTGWRKYRAVVDLSGWTEAERTGMRISVRPNTGTGTTGASLPQGPCPKQFWFDDFSMRPASTVGTLEDLRLTAIQVARERQELAANAGFTDEANALQADINTLTATTVPLVPDKGIGFFPAPIHTSAATNPFIQAMNSWAGTYLGQAFPPSQSGLPPLTTTKSTSASMVFPGGRGLAPIIRETGATAESLYWLLVSPLSEYRYNPDLFYRFLHILYASADDYNTHGASGEIDEVPGATTSGLNDWFASPTFAYSWRMADYSFADYIPTTFKNRMRNASDIMGGIYFTIAQTGLAGGTYVNRDVSYAEVLAQTGLHRNRTDWTNFARTIVTSLNTQCIYPDGAYSYIREQNEVANYHGGTTTSLAKIHAVLDVPEALTAISKTANYELISVEPTEVPEFFTAPSWKTQWNGQSGFSGEPLVFVTGNPYLKGQLDQFRALFGTGYNSVFRKQLPSPLNVSFYRNDITAKPLPDNYVVYDRNIQGPRARYGRFSYAISGRDVDASEVVGTTSPGGLPGMQTFVGAMTTQAGRQTVNGVNRDELNAALMAVHSKVHVRTSANQEWRDWVYTSTRIKPKTTVTKTATAFSASGGLQRQNVGPTTFDSDWGTFQQWITLPDRIIGVVETFPKNGNPAQALEIDGRVRFTYGRGELQNPKSITVLEANKRYAYGNLQTIVHDHDFTQISTGTAGILRDDFPTAEEIIFRYNLSDGTNLYTYAGDTRKYFVIEIRQNGAVGDATVSRVSNGDLKGLIVQLNGQSYRAFRNLGNAQITLDVSTSLTAGTIHKLYYSRTDNEPQTPQTFTAVPGAPANLVLPANEQVFLVSGGRGEPLSDGFANFNTLLNAMDAPPGAQLLASNNGVLPCNNPLLTLAVSTSAATGPLTYNFSGPGIVSTSGSSATVNAVGVYSVTVTNTSNGLSSTASLNINLAGNTAFESPPTPSSTTARAGSALNVSYATDPTGCPFDLVTPFTVELTGAQSATVASLTSNTTGLRFAVPAGLPPGTYAVRVRYGSDVLSQPFTLTVTAAEVFRIVATKTQICEGQTVRLTALGCTGTVRWSTGQEGPFIDVSPASTTTITAACQEN
ncbi:carboxypeptidase-like regulatory domain-containing protein [Rudanella lutea]|uniref:COG1470 family protein n=1 Tax=Rudanella lutea TaxID=451374 RepID=UPI00039DE0BE|nr:carboxypeptidase-like regulatory domain-containing protein [Rudanella lutea]